MSHLWAAYFVFQSVIPRLHSPPHPPFFFPLAYQQIETAQAHMGGKKEKRGQKEGKKGYFIIKETAEEKHCGQKKTKVDTNTLCSTCFLPLPQRLS